MDLVMLEYACTDAWETIRIVEKGLRYSGLKLQV